MNSIAVGGQKVLVDDKFPSQVACRILGRIIPGDAPYRLRLASSGADIRAAQSLRFQVFNVELNEGLEESYATRRDEDRFDAVCDHLLVEDVRSDEVVGTYRMQTGVSAVQNLGFYSEQEFDFSAFQEVHENIVELGRACVHADHRGLPVLSLLWRGIRDYALKHDARFLIGCSSITSQSEETGAAAYHELAASHLAEPPFRTVPLPRFQCSLANPQPSRPRIPKLLRAYLSLGARICGPPAIDREFKTIDFLTVMDIARLSQFARGLA